MAVPDWLKWILILLALIPKYWFVIGEISLSAFDYIIGSVLESKDPILSSKWRQRTFTQVNWVEIRRIDDFRRDPNLGLRRSLSFSNNALDLVDC